MPSFAFSDVLDESRKVYLNDPAAELFTNTVLLPFGVHAYDELNNKLARAGHSTVISELYSPPVDITAGTKEYNFSAVTDAMEPILLWERPDGSVSDADWIEMTHVQTLEPREPAGVLGEWALMKNNRIMFNAALVTREIRILYFRGLYTATPIAGDVVQVINSKPYLSARTAALAAGHIGGNVEKATYIQADADAALDDILGIQAQQEQNAPTRRRPFRR